MIVLMALIAVSMAITVIAQPLRNRFGPPGADSTTTSARSEKTSKAPAPEKTKAPPIESKNVQVAASLNPGTARTVRVAVGDRLTLFVRVIKPTEVSIPGLGLFAYADPYAPARFDLLVREPGRFGVETASGRNLGTIETSRERGE